ncbi:MAG TPA: hypothetical protein VFV34_25065 [Blastocatellia bacterium]|nr:hypothetical protein [Blastocatellia bacterium]
MQGTGAGPLGSSEIQRVVPMPIFPLMIEYQYQTRYFVQWLSDHQRYASIEASVEKRDAPAVLITLSDKSGHRTSYCSTEEAATAMSRAGQDARRATIDFRVSNRFGELPSYEFGFMDQHRQKIRWRFVMASPPSERGAGLTPQEGSKGWLFIYRDEGTAAGEGTEVQIGDEVIEATPWPEISSPPYFVAYRGAYSEGVGIGVFPTGREEWRVTTTASELREGGQWAVENNRGRTRLLTITSIRADELTINDSTGSLSIRARKPPLVADRGAGPQIAAAGVTNPAVEGLALRSMTFSSNSRTMRITFSPDLNPASPQAAPVAFQIDQNGHDKIAHGFVTARKSGDATELRWQLKAPDWARARVLTTAITITPAGYILDAR